MPKALSQTASARWKRSNKAKVKESLRLWMVANAERRDAYMAQYHLKKKEHYRIADAERYLRPENVAKRLAKKAEKKAYMKRWASLNPHYGSVSHSKRKARQRANGIGDQKVIRDWIKTWKSKRRVRCFWCQKTASPKDCHSEHIIPLKSGGAHSIENLCISCADCNRHKHDKILTRWNQFLAEPILI